MALFFFVTGLKIRRELDMGELRERRRVAAPVLAALGGMTVPVLLYLALNARQPSAAGWGIVMGTDTAFALGVLVLVRGASARVRTFPLTLVVVVDDAVALTVVALAYTDDVSWAALLVAVALFAAAALLRAAGVTRGAPYALLGVGVWGATLASGVHATVAGVALGLMVHRLPTQAGGTAPGRRPLARLPRESDARAGPPHQPFRHRSVSSNERYQHLFHSWTSYLVVPLFALATAGLALDAGVLARAATSPITIGIVLGLVAGKVVGIVGATWAAAYRGGLPLPLPWAQLVGTSTLGGIGFTVSLLIAGVSFTGEALEEAKAGILAASLLAAALAWVVFRVLTRLPGRARTAGADRRADHRPGGPRRPRGRPTSSATRTHP